MNGLLVRVGADSTVAGGEWHGPVDEWDGRFVYVPIPESHPQRAGLETPYSMIVPALQRFGVALPATLAGRNMHLDPDFRFLTYGDHGQRARQLVTTLGRGDLLVFYAALRSIRDVHRLVYALIGMYTVDTVEPIAAIPPVRWSENAHSRRKPEQDQYGPRTDVIIYGQPASSGQFDRCLPIGEYRDGAWRVTRGLLETWDGLSVRDGYLQRSARLPTMHDAKRVLRWLDAQKVVCTRAE